MTSPSSRGGEEGVPFFFWGGVCEKPRKNRCRIEMKSGDTLERVVKKIQKLVTSFMDGPFFKAFFSWIAHIIKNLSIYVGRYKIIYI